MMRGCCVRLNSRGRQNTSQPYAYERDYRRAQKNIPLQTCASDQSARLEYLSLLPTLSALFAHLILPHPCGPLEIPNDRRTREQYKIMPIALAYDRQE